MNITTITASKPTVYVVDDDKSIRDSMRILLKSAGLPLASFSSAEEFLENVPENAVGCLLLDARLSGMDGLELVHELAKREIKLPIIMLTGHASVDLAIDALTSGVFAFVQKPCKDKFLAEKLKEAFDLGEKWREIQAERVEIARRMAKLTPREKEVMEHLVLGKKNLVIAEELGISRKTLDIHRAKVMIKMEARTVADIVRWYYTDNPKALPVTSLAR